MLHNYDIKLLAVLVKWGQWTGLTLLKWDDKKKMVALSKSIWSYIAWSITMGLAAVAVPLVVWDYFTYLNKYGFNLDDEVHIFKYFYSTSGCLLVCLHFYHHWKREELVVLTNQTIHFFRSVSVKYNIKSTWKFNIHPLLYTGFILSALTCPGMFGLMYLMQCKFHTLHGAFPIVCHLGGPDSHILFKIAVKIIATLTIWNLGSSIFMSVLMAFYPATIFILYGMELSHTLEKLSYRDHRRRADFLQIYKCLEILKFRFSEYNGVGLVTGNFFIVFAMYVVSFCGILLGKVGPITTVGLMYIVLIFFIYYSCLQFCWKSTDILAGIRNTCFAFTKQLVDRKTLMAPSDIIVEFGNFGHINRGLFALLGDFIINNTISVLLM